MKDRSPHPSAIERPSHIDSTPLVLPPRGSIERTAALVRNHGELSRDDLRRRDALRQTPDDLAIIIKEIHAEFKHLLWNQSISPLFAPTRTFLHTNVVVPGDETTSHYLNFLAEVRNPVGHWIVLSEHGWSLHRSGPAFSHIHASFSLPTQFFAHKLYSLDAFCEEIDTITKYGLESLLGFKPRSFILESALDSIQTFRDHLRPEPSGFSRVEVLSHADTVASIRLVAPCLGAFTVQVQLNSQRGYVVCSARSVEF